MASAPDNLAARLAAMKPQTEGSLSSEWGAQLVEILMAGQIRNVIGGTLANAGSGRTLIIPPRLPAPAAARLPLQLYQIDPTHVGIQAGTVDGYASSVIPTVDGVDLTVPPDPIEVTGPTGFYLHIVVDVDEDNNPLDIASVEVVTEPDEDTFTDGYLLLGFVNWDGDDSVIKGVFPYRSSSIQILVCEGVWYFFQS